MRRSKLFQMDLRARARSPRTPEAVIILITLITRGNHGVRIYADV